MNRAEILDSVKKTICNDRQDVHGNPEDTHQLIAEYWQTYINHLFILQGDLCLSPRNVAEMMILFKLARNQMNPTHTDNLHDLIGYGVIAVELSDVKN